MSLGIIDSSHLENLADKIRLKTGKTKKLSIAQMTSSIDDVYIKGYNDGSIEGGGADAIEPVLDSIIVEQKRFLGENVTFYVYDVPYTVISGYTWEELANFGMYEWLYIDEETSEVWVEDFDILQKPTEYPVDNGNYPLVTSLVVFYLEGDSRAYKVPAGYTWEQLSKFKSFSEWNDFDFTITADNWTTEDPHNVYDIYVDTTLILSGNEYYDEDYYVFGHYPINNYTYGG